MGRNSVGRWLREPERLVLLAVSALLVAGGIAALAGRASLGHVLWTASVVLTLVPALSWVLADLRRKRYGADLLAVLALVGTITVGEYLAGAVIAVMVATGRVLESAAGRRAHRDLAALLARAPVTVHRRQPDDTLATVAVADVVPGDRLVVLPSEIVAVDGTVVHTGVFDESALTGEPDPVTRTRGDHVRSGVVNAGAAVDVVASATADESTYAHVVRLAEQASAESAPVARLADRIAVWFLPLALVIAALAWALSGDPVRAVAVLVTATPCPLLLAVPIAVTGGMSRMSRSGVVVKGGAALERLGRVRSVVMDKTGTVTAGRPEVTDVVCAPDVAVADALAAAAAVETFSPHVLASAVVRAAARAGAEPLVASDVREPPGEGAVGIVDGRRVAVGRVHMAEDLPDWASGVLRRARLDLATIVWVDIDDVVVAAFLLRDQLRPEAARTLRRLRAAGVSRLVMLTGDKLDNAAEVAALLGVDDVQARALPEDKVARVRAERRHGPTVMIGDGVNDAPALAAADVGIALGSRGSTAATGMADAVIVDDRIDRLADAVEVARRTRRLAMQSGVVGTVLSLLAMMAAAAGLLVPVAGALVQEAIDVVVILNALRAVRGRLRRRHPRAGALLRRFAGEHDGLVRARIAVRQAADALADGPGDAADDAVSRARSLLVSELLPHEHREEHQLYPALVDVLGSAEATLTMSRAHAEIDRLARRLDRHLAESDDGHIQPDQVDDLRATLYGLDAILTLHFAQEEEAYFTLTSAEPAPR